MKLGYLNTHSCMKMKVTLMKINQSAPVTLRIMHNGEFTRHGQTRSAERNSREATQVLNVSLESAGTNANQRQLQATS